MILQNKLAKLSESPTSIAKKAISSGGLACFGKYYRLAGEINCLSVVKLYMLLKK